MFLENAYRRLISQLISHVFDFYTTLPVMFFSSSRQFASAFLRTCLEWTTAANYWTSSVKVCFLC